MPHNNRMDGDAVNRVRHARHYSLSDYDLYMVHYFRHFPSGLAKALAHFTKPVSPPVRPQTPRAKTMITVAPQDLARKER
jgi:hypothetical protein